jgi:hypothetical protein
VREEPEHDEHPEREEDLVAEIRCAECVDERLEDGDA